MNKIIYITLILFSILFLSCKKENKGFNLQKFKVVNNNLLNIIHFADSINSVDLNKKTIVLELKVSDSNPEFRFSFQDSSFICHYIFSNNYRIVGYLDNGDNEIILLTDIDYITSFELKFYEFVKPTYEHKLFKYIYFPDNQYGLTKDGRVFPPTGRENGYLIFNYKNKGFHLE